MFCEVGGGSEGINGGSDGHPMSKDERFSPYMFMADMLIVAMPVSLSLSLSLSLFLAIYVHSRYIEIAP